MLSSCQRVVFRWLSRTLAQSSTLMARVLWLATGEGKAEWVCFGTAMPEVLQGLGDQGQDQALGQYRFLLSLLRFHVWVHVLLNNLCQRAEGGTEILA